MREWESDPLFAAAEVVQDSADRMESIFRHLLHEECVQRDHPDTNLPSSIESIRRDLATTLETAKWQLEDFEKEVNLSAMTNNFPMKQNVIRRHKQFIGAIRAQIIRVEQSMDTSAGNSLRNMNFNDRDMDGLELFLSGGKPFKQTENQEQEDNNILRRFLDPAVSSSSKEDIDGNKASEIVSLNVNEIAYAGHNLELKEESSTQIGLEHPSSVQEANYDLYNEEASWDLEANGGAKGKSYLQKNNLGSFSGRMNVFGPLSVYRYWAGRSFAKRLKDGEEQMPSPSHGYVPPVMQRCSARLRSACGCHNIYLKCSQLSAQIMQSSSWIRDFREKSRRSLHPIQVRHHRLLFILVVVLTLLLLGIIVS